MWRFGSGGDGLRTHKGFGSQRGDWVTSDCGLIIVSTRRKIIYLFYAFTTILSILKCIENAFQWLHLEKQAFNGKLLRRRSPCPMRNEVESFRDLFKATCNEDVLGIGLWSRQKPKPFGTTDKSVSRMIVKVTDRSSGHRVIRFYLVRRSPIRPKEDRWQKREFPNDDAMVCSSQRDVLCHTLPYPGVSLMITGVGHLPFAADGPFRVLMIDPM